MDAYCAGADRVTSFPDMFTDAALREVTEGRPSGHLPVHLTTQRAVDLMRVASRLCR
ncbi:hypothetical protein CCE01nite_22840 [Cellulomonas cellasea]|nr:hypothetical protein CCE01nite_22840 [Cellulomonas cellasea]